MNRSSVVLRGTRAARFALLAVAAVALLSPSFAAPQRTALPGSAYTLAASPTPSISGQWSNLMNWPLVAVHSIVLRTGKVLMFDAWETGGTPSARLWDPATQAFTPVPLSVSQIFCSGHVQLSDGRVLVVGGHNGADYGIQDVNVFDPSSNSWSPAAFMSFARWYPGVNELPDGRVVAIAGDVSPVAVANTPEVYDPAANRWSTLSSVNTAINYDNYPQSYVLPSGSVFVTDDQTGLSRLLNVASQSWTNAPTDPVTFGSSAMYRPGKILVSGGGPRYGGGLPSQTSAAVIDMTGATPAWTMTSPMAYPRYNHNLVVLPDGTVMAAGGSTTVDISAGSGSATPEIWNPQTGAWTAMATEQQPRMYHSTAVLLPDGRVLVAGGGRISGAVDYPTAEIFSPPYLFKGARPAIGSAPASISYAGSFAVQSPDAGTIASVALVSLPSNTHTLNFGAGYIPLNFSASGTTLNVTGPTSASVAPPGYYYLFLVNASGVPSVASVVRVTQTPGTTPPVVSVTAPAGGASVSGTSVTVSATATSSMGVASVQFLLDGSPVGPSLTAAPYSFTWDSTTAPNGAHQLSARATDAAGNVATSAAVGVTISNPMTPPAITNVAAASLTASSATITWTTDRAADSQVDYGTTTTYGASSTLDTALVESHSEQLSGLAPSTLYHYRVRSRDVNGNANVSGDSTFTTLSAVPTFRSTSSSTSSTTVGKPAGVVAGDVMLATLEIDEDPATVTGPAGWQPALDTLAGAGTASAFHMQTWYKVATASEPASYSWNVSGSPWVGISVADYAGVSQTAPIDVSSGRDAGITATPTTPSVTTSAGSDLLVAIFDNFNYGAWTAGSGMTQRYDVDSKSLQDAPQPAAGATGARTATNAVSGQTAAQILALRAPQANSQPPTVAMTAPAPGATVSGTAVTVSASAADSAGVASVQFQLDGSPLGSPVTAQPYQIGWDTTKVANGSHTLTATATSTAGGTATAAPITATVQNAPPPPPLISSVQAGSVTSTTATVTWTTSTPASSTVQYGTTTAYSATVSSTSLVTSHSQALTSLQPSTTYHYQVTSTDAYGQSSSSADAVFTTPATPPSPPSFRSQSTTVNGTSVARPSGAQAGDLLLASLEIDADPATVTGPAGWSLLMDTPAALGTAKAYHAQVWYKVATASEPTSYSWTVAGAPYVDVAVLDYSGASTASPIDASSGRYVGITATPTTDSVNTAAANDLVVAIFVDYDFGSWTAGPGMTQRYNVDSTSAQDAVQAAAGATGGRTATNTVSGPTTAQIVAIRAK